MGSLAISAANSSSSNLIPLDELFDFLTFPLFDDDGDDNPNRMNGRGQWLGRKEGKWKLTIKLFFGLARSIISVRKRMGH